MNMYKLYTTLYTTFRTFSLATQNVKPPPPPLPPLNLEVSLLEGAKADNSFLVDLYSATYLREEPLVQAAALTDLSEIKSFVAMSLRNQHSVVLREKGSGEVVAAASGGPVTYSTHDQLRLYAEGTMNDLQSKRLIHLWAAIVAESKILDTLRLPAIWDVSYLATAPHMRRRGLARFMVSHQRRLARKLGYGATSLFCACPYTTRLARQLKCVSLGSRPANSYKDATGQPWVSGTARVETFYCLLRPKGVKQFPPKVPEVKVKGKGKGKPQLPRPLRK